MRSLYILFVGHRQRARGFSLVELLVVIAIIAILSGVVLASLSGVHAQGRNAERATDTATILNAVYQYALDNNNQLPSAITTATTTICRTGATSCAGLANLSVLTNSQKYLVTIPSDPTNTSSTSTGYTIVKNSYGRVTVSAPSAEGSTTISVTR